MWKDLTSGVTVLPDSEKLAIVDALPPSGLLAAARVSGTKAVDADGVFDQISTDFKFPTWFGWNWNALSDCLRDLSWLPADRYLVIVENVSHLLAEDASYRKDFFQILDRAAKHWENPLNKPGGSKISFRTICLAPEADVNKIRGELGIIG
ncbi:barstar family protein [Amycolatopsis sp. NPDC098790]|uniref:barstar family protein n=1 Tax=Amycolatopsis sp. NPDC098790 TaxID=3363939 RepID=UPI0038019AD7